MKIEGFTEDSFNKFFQVIDNMTIKELLALKNLSFK